MQGEPATDLLQSDFAALAATVRAPTGSADELARNLGQVYDLVFAADLARYDVPTARRSAAGLMQAIFDLRMELRAGIRDWQARGLMSEAAQKALRDAFRVSRYAVDMLGEIATGYEQLAAGAETYKAFAGGPLNTQFGPAVAPGAPLDFRAGDVLLQRGQLHNSAAIARIGDVDSQFSHIAMIFIGDDGRQWVVESLIEDGAVINTLDYAIGHGLGRCVLYRHKNEALAARAAKLIHDRVVRSRSGGGTRILYDFTMELDPNEELFCSKLVSQAFLEASDGTVKLPAFPTRLDMQNRDFFERIGVTAKTTFAPADIDLEPGFDLIAEWQDYRVTSNLRLQDMVMTKLLEWMEEGAKFKEDGAIHLIAYLGRASSYLSDKAKNLIQEVVPKVPSNMSRRTIATIAMLHKTAEIPYRRLQTLERESIANTGHGLHPRDVLAELERMREASKGRIGYLAGLR